MSYQVSTAIDSIARINALVPAGHDRRDFLIDLLDGALHGDSAVESMSMGIVSSSARRRAIASAQLTVESLDDITTLCERPEGIVDLGVIEWLLRPALLLTGGRFAPPKSGIWNAIDGGGAESIAQGVCRIDIAGAADWRIHLGTGFFFGWEGDNAAIVTNAHVVEAARDRFGWPSFGDARLEATFDCEADRSSPTYVELSSRFRVHKKHDLAVLHLNTRFISPSQRPIKLRKDPPEKMQGGALAVIGHPSFDSNVDPFPKLFGFGELFGVKRLSPGFLRIVQKREWRRAVVDVAVHDASTLSGSSGSCVFDLKTGIAIGLHFGGWPKRKIDLPSNPHLLESAFEANGAVPIWKLQRDPMFKSIDIQWC